MGGKSWIDVARAAMKARKITYKDMGYELGISESAVSHQLNGRRGVTLQQIKVYSKVLGMPISELVGDDAVFVSDDSQLKAIELIKKIPPEQKEIALKMLEAFTESSKG